MPKNILLIAILLTLSAVGLQAQQQYEPTESSPFGLPNPEAPPEIKDYQSLIGICDCTSQRIGADGVWGDSVTMIWEFRYIMNGMAVQDLTLKEDGGHSGSIRQYNADSSRWYVHYFSTAGAAPQLATWEGGYKGEEIVLYKEQTAPNGMEGMYRITFYDISDEGFRWKGEWVDQSQTVVFPTWKIDCTKRE